MSWQPHPLPYWIIYKDRTNSDDLTKRVKTLWVVSDTSIETECELSVNVVENASLAYSYDTNCF